MKTAILFLFLFFIHLSQSLADTPPPKGTDPQCGLCTSLYQAFEKKNYTFIKDTASKHKKDIFLYPLCQLLLFKAHQTPPKDFIEAFPNDKKKYSRFFYSPWGCVTTPDLLASKTAKVDPYTYFVLLVDLMTQNNRLAIDKIMKSIPLMDGYIAEEILWVKLPDFVKNHPLLVLENWDLFKGKINAVDSDLYDKKTYEELLHLRETVQKAKADKTSKTGFLKYLDFEIGKHKAFRP